MSIGTSESDGADLIAAGLSTAREKVLEHRLISDLAVLMLRRGISMDVLRSEFDAQGHDVVLEAAGIIRHVQLKASVDGGARRDVDINIGLQAKPSGCVVWMSYDPVTLAITSYRWFGGEPGQPLPSLGDRPTRHTRGKKAIRPALRNVAKSRFERLAGLEELADELFGPPRSLPTSIVMAQLRQRFGSEWSSLAARIPAATGFHQSAEFAHFIDGYRVLDQLCELNPAAWLDRMTEADRSGWFTDDLGLLWTQLFMEHRRWRHASPTEPDQSELARLDELAWRVGTALAGELEGTDQHGSSP